MIIREKDMTREIRVKPLGGEGQGEFKDLVPPELLKGEARMFNLVTLEPGAAIGLHDHTGNFEIYYLLTGKGLCNDNGQDVEVEAGDVVYTADGAQHSLKNIGDDPLVMVASVIFENK